MIFAVWEDWENINVGEACLIALIAIIIVFLVLGIIIFISFLCQKGIGQVERKTRIMPREENKILEEDEDAVVATLVAGIDFYNETGKEANIVSVTRIED